MKRDPRPGSRSLCPVVLGAKLELGPGDISGTQRVGLNIKCPKRSEHGFVGFLVVVCVFLRGRHTNGAAGLGISWTKGLK